MVEAVEKCDPEPFLIEVANELQTGKSSTDYNHMGQVGIVLSGFAFRSHCGCNVTMKELNTN